MSFEYHDYNDEYAFEVLVEQLGYLKHKFRNSSGQVTDKVIIEETRKEFDQSRDKALGLLGERWERQ